MFGTLEMQLETASVLMVGVVIEETVSKPKPDEVEKIVGWSMIALLSLCPVLFALVLWRNRKNLHKPSIKQKIGSMYEGLDATKPKAGFYVVVFLLRRSAFVLATFLLYHRCEMQVTQM